MLVLRYTTCRRSGTKRRESSHKRSFVYIVADPANEDGPLRFCALFHVAD